ncbi:hypothetical protein [Natrononativus amylolyticus]|uniref:hypothetical protein n=1 Tax=Natrononativus amylolyticus TaxID=2963434 RepID=UPI0020CCC12C|nr:hypothetical protein [Natrononativus amylolyticus]
MYSKHHAAVSLVVGLALVAVLAPVTVGGVGVPSAALVLYAVAVGVFIDLDHFVIARATTGDWRALRFCLRRPVAAFTDQDLIFDSGDVGALSRLLSHLLLSGLFVVALAVASVPLAVLTGVVLYVHVVTDVWWDLDRYHRGDAVAVGSRRD